MVANRLQSEAEVVSVDGQETYTLRFGTNACIEIEDALKVTDIPAFLKQATKRKKDFRTLVRILLHAHHPEIDTDEKAGDVMDRMNGMELGIAVACAFHGLSRDQLLELAKKPKPVPKEEPRPEAEAAAGPPIS